MNRSACAILGRHNCWRCNVAGLGDSSTRTITLQAGGLPGAQLPPIDPPEIAGIKTYPDQPKREDVTTASGIDALGVNSAAWVITRDGEYQLPEVRIPWWDTKARQVRYATLPARTLSIEPAAPSQAEFTTTPTPGDSLQTPAPSGIAQAGFWPWTTAAALLGWLVTSLWLWRRRTVDPDATAEVAQAINREGTLFKQVLKHCKNNQATDARSAITRWLALLWPQKRNPTLADLTAAEPVLAGLIEQLEQCLYAATMGGAFEARMEDKVGSLEFGKYADLVILEEDVFSVLPSDIADVKIMATMKGGTYTYQSHQ